MTHSDDEGFLARWSRRKRATVDGKPVPSEPTAAVPKDDGDDEHVAIENGDPVALTVRDGDSGCKVLKRVLTEADFADVDFTALDFKSDYTRFMQHGVPDSVRNKALRQLWASDPIMANMDGLHDWWDDYTDAAVAVPAGTLKTAYRIGKGFLSDDEVAEWEALGKPVTAPAPSAVAATDPAAVAANDDLPASGACPEAAAAGSDTSAEEEGSGAPQSVEPRLASPVVVSQDEGDAPLSEIGLDAPNSPARQS